MEDILLPSTCVLADTELHFMKFRCLKLKNTHPQVPERGSGISGEWGVSGWQLNSGSLSVSLLYSGLLLIFKSFLHSLQTQLWIGEDR